MMMVGMMTIKREAFAATNAKSTIKSAKLQIDDNDEVIKQPHQDYQTTNYEIKNHNIRIAERCH